MLFTLDFTVPANTTAQNPAKTEIEIEGGMLLYVSVLVPYGHNAMAGMRIEYGEAPLVPGRKDQWLKGNGETITTWEFWPLPEKTTKLRVLGYNNSTKHDHTFYIRFVTIPKQMAKLILVSGRTSSALFNFLNKVVGVEE